jgi:hypothetical protein
LWWWLSKEKPRRSGANLVKFQLWFDVLAISNGPKDALKKLLNFYKPL